jgi:hypothetical protein
MLNDSWTGRNPTRVVVPIEEEEEERVFYMKTYVHLWSYLVQFFSEWEVFQTEL